MSFRDYDLENIIFDAPDGKSYSIKKMREYPQYKFMKKVEIQKGDMLDEIACRPDVYGENSEAEYYKIAEFNMIDLFDVRFDLDRIKVINIPVL